MDASRYLDCLAADYGDLRDAVATVEPGATVPGCPGWTVADLVVHVSQVYLHKAALIRTGEEPQPWPPPGLAARPPLALLGCRAGTSWPKAATTPSPSPPAKRPGRSARRRARSWWKTAPAAIRGCRSRGRPAPCCAGCEAGPATTRSGWPAIPPGRTTCAACSPKLPSKAPRRTRNPPPRRAGHLAGAAGRHAFSVTDPATVARIVALADALPVYPPGVRSCPADFGGAMRLAVLARPGGPVLARFTAGYGGRPQWQ